MNRPAPLEPSPSCTQLLGSIEGLRGCQEFIAALHGECHREVSYGIAVVRLKLQRSCLEVGLGLNSVIHLQEKSVVARCRFSVQATETAINVIAVERSNRSTSLTTNVDSGQEIRSYNDLKQSYFEVYDE